MSDEGKEPDESGAADQPEKQDGERMELPSWNRSRSKRKANVNREDREDAFQRGVKQAGIKALAQPRYIIAGLVVLTAAIGLGVYLRSSSKAGSSDTTRRLAAAVAAEHRGRVIDLAQLGLADISDAPDPLFQSREDRDQAVLSALEALESEGSQQDVVRLGKLVRGARALRTGDFETATSEYNAFLAEAASDHPLRFLAVEGRGLALEGSGDHEGALKVFEELAPNEGDFYRDQALYSQGRVLESLGRQDDAVDMYKRYFQEFPPEEAGMSQEQVRRRLEVLAPEALADLVDTGLEIRDGAAGVPGVEP